MKDSGKLILAALGLVTYLWYFKFKQPNNCPKCPECPSQTPNIIVNPSNVIDAVKPIVKPVESNNVQLPIQEILVYKGPEKFQVHAPTASDSSVTITYYAIDGSYFKIINSANDTGTQNYITITKQEIINAWNSIN